MREMIMSVNEKLIAILLVLMKKIIYTNYIMDKSRVFYSSAEKVVSR